MNELIEEVLERIEQETYRGEMPVHNKQVLRDRLAFLWKHAAIDNWATRELEKFGLEGDGSINDFDLRLD